MVPRLPGDRLADATCLKHHWIHLTLDYHTSVLGILQFYSTSTELPTECLAVPDEVFDELWRRPEAAERRVIIPVQFLFDLPVAGREGFRPIKMTAFVLPCPPVWYFDEGEFDYRPSNSIADIL